MKKNFEKTKKLLKNLENKYPYDPLKDNEIAENENLKIIGITGSNGKTTTAKIVHEYLKLKGKESILFSSAGIDSPLSNNSKNEEVEIPIYNETSVINALNGAIKDGADYLIIEVNERTLKKGYVKDIPFDIRAITNIVPKHNTLQYTEEEYIAIKKSFFQNIPAEDDCTCIYGLNTKELFEEMIALNDKPYKTFSSQHIANIRGVEESKIDYMLYPNKKVFDTLKGIDLGIKTKTKSYEFSTGLIMPFNALNITLAMAIIDTLGEFDEKIFSKLLKSISIPGRDELIKIKGRTIIISITCTPHLEILKKYKDNGEIKNIKLITGSFGNGFTTWLPEYKDEKFAKYVTESMKWVYKYIVANCDYVYITANDNAATPIKELLDAQIAEVNGKIGYEAIEDRKEAIKKAISESKPGDVIFISGRGNRSMFCKNSKELEFYLDKDIVNNEINNIKE